MNIRYRLQNVNTGEIDTFIKRLEDIEEDGLNRACYWKLLSRDLGTGLHDKTGVEIFERDLLLTPGKFKISVRIDSIGHGDPKFFNIGFEVCEVIGRSDE